MMDDTVGKYDEYIMMLKRNMNIIEGELYKFERGKIKKSANHARRALLNIKKMCDTFRKCILKDLQTMPTKKRNWSLEDKAEMVENRKTTLEGKELKKKKLVERLKK